MAVKRFLDQDILGESLEEFKSEVLAAHLFSFLNIAFAFKFSGTFLKGIFCKLPRLAVLVSL